MTLDEFMLTLTTKSDDDGNPHVVATQGLPPGLRSSIRPRGSQVEGRVADHSPEFFLSLMGRFHCWWIADDEEVVFELDGVTRVWPSPWY